MSDNSLMATKPTGRPERHWSRGWTRSVLYVVYLAVLAWLGVKLLWWILFDVPISQTPNADTVWENYYPELWKSGAIESHPMTDDATLDVLLLGGSVLQQVAQKFESELSAMSASPVRVFSLATSSHTSRDSRNKSWRLRDKPFDWIVFYHGINDVRMNCCSTSEFRQDYSHCAWYDAFSRRLQAGRLTLSSLAVDHLWSKAIELGPPNPAQLDWGDELKTPPAFRDNVAANQRPGQRVILATFACYIPENYSRDRLRNHELDYGHGQFELAAELWGKPANVIAGINAHNQQVREVASEYPNTLLVELALEIPHSVENFSDPCHLTDRGCELFVSRLLAAVQPLRSTKQASDTVGRRRRKVAESLRDSKVPVTESL